MSDEISTDQFPLVGYKEADILGSGAYGDVTAYLGPNGEEIAIKRIKDVEGAPPNKYLKRERDAMKLDHENIVRFYGRDYSDLNNQIKLAIVMERCNGSLLDLLRSRRLTVSECNQIMLQVVKGLGYLKQMGFLHRDIKAANILLVVNGRNNRQPLSAEEWREVLITDVTVKIADFGFARLVSDLTMTGGIGTRYYIAPELRNSSDFRYGHAADTFSAAILYLEMLTGKVKYRNLNHLNHRVGNEIEPSSVISLLKRMIKEEPQERATIEAVEGSLHEMLNDIAMEWGS